MKININDYPNDQQLRELCLLYHEEGREVTPIEVIEFCVIRANNSFGQEEVVAPQMMTPKEHAKFLINCPCRLALWDHYHNSKNST